MKGTAWSATFHTVVLHSTTITTWKEYNISVLHALKALVLILIIIVPIFSNLLVIFSVIFYRRLQAIKNYFLVSLAFAVS